jgi:mannose-6-phosphate isomerase-like protein (cupin superfamily)
MKIFNVKEVGKFSDQNPNQPGSEVAEMGYVRHRVINNDICSVTVACFRDGEVPVGLHRHPGAAEVYYVVEGEALCTDANGVTQRLGPGNAVYFDVGEPHNMHSAPGQDCMYYRVQIGRERRAERNFQ